MTSGGPAEVARPLVSVVTPIFNEAGNLPRLFRRLAAALDPLDVDWEWIAVDDHSVDGTEDVLGRLVQDDQRVRAIRLARNFGSHAAIACGLDAARGDAAVVMTADLQHPPETIPALVERWQSGTEVVWGVPGAASVTRLLSSRLYEHLVRRLVGPEALPPSNADFVLVDRAVIEAVRGSDEGRRPIFMLVAGLGFHQDSIEYTRARRAHGMSGWTLKKKIGLATDSMFAFMLPPRRPRYIIESAATSGRSSAPRDRLRREGGRWT